jgi:N-hydroxyarylamine O-acetyltransferase
MDTDAYLERIGLERPRQADLGTLTLLQHAHLLSVPFENLDIWQGTPIELDVDAMFDRSCDVGAGATATSSMGCSPACSRSSASR